MALKINLEKETDDMAKWKANRDLFTDRNGIQVEAGDPAAAFLLVREGRELTEGQMKRHKVRKTHPDKKKSKAQPKAADKAAKKGGNK